MPYYLGIDGGGTKTTCAVGDESKLLAMATAGASNIVRVGQSQARQSLQQSFDHVPDEATALVPRVQPDLERAPVPSRVATSDRVRLRGHAPAEGAQGGLAARARTADERFHELGDLLFSVINVARKLHTDPELALHAAADRFRGRVERGSSLATSEGREWNDLAPEEQLAYYARARLTEGDD